MKPEAALRKMESDLGVDRFDLAQAALYDGLAAATCTLCGHSEDNWMEPDQRAGYCPSCGRNRVKSVLVLMGMS